MFFSGSKVTKDNFNISFYMYCDKFWQLATFLVYANPLKSIWKSCNTQMLNLC